jgi:hypothetical protein
MKLSFPQAFRPLMDTKICISLSAPKGADSVLLTASVASGNPYATNVGMTALSEQWVVSFATADLVSGVKLTRGCKVNVLGNFSVPKLTVQNVYTVGGITSLECTANERGVF